MEWGFFVLNMSDVILLALICLCILTVIYCIVESYVKYLWMRIKGAIQGYYIDTHGTSYFTGYGYMNRYEVRYKHKWKDGWKTYAFDVQKHRIPEKIKKLEEELKNKRL